ncbi:GNAT family N-acetyltransferase [Glutamicibacter ectropisis]|uniref:GNAT family N-acetyltransferase n=1 Tax=Glutamicibacter ectropisis TaxID=3046593 RepID=UPI0031EB9E22
MLTEPRRDCPWGDAYLDDQPVGWCSISPRTQIPRLEASKLIRPVDDVAVWSIICMVVRGGFRRRGVNREMVRGAVEYARKLGAPAVEAYPVDPEGRMDLTMAFVGTRKMFEELGFEVVGVSDAQASRMPRLIMRKML